MGDVVFGRLGVPNARAVEIGQRRQCRDVLSGIRVGSRRIAVGVDHVTMKCRAHRGDIARKPVIQRMDMPVGIRHQAAAVIQLRGDVVRDVRARMGQSQNDGAIAPMDFHRIHFNRHLD